jgi:hypothetical protein
MKKLFIFMAAVLLSACTKPPETSTEVGLEFVVDKLFTHEGCTVYRFVDGGYNRYFTNCSGSVSWSESCGKNCTRNMNIDGNK